MTRAQRRTLEKAAKSLVEVCVRNALEDLHAGNFPSSQRGDYSDGKVVTPYGEIPWARASRISDEEMKLLMIDIVNKTYTFLCYAEELATESAETRRWSRPKLDRDLVISVRYRRAACRGLAHGRALLLLVFRFFGAAARAVFFGVKVRL
jgi:hypothetical protein